MIKPITLWVYCIGFTLLASSTLACTADSRGVVVTGLSAIQDKVLGPLICYGASPWVYGDAAEKGTADNLAPVSIAEAPALGSALSGTVSWTTGTNVVTTSANLTTPLAGVSWVAFAWTSIDGAGTGRVLCPIGSFTSTTIVCSENISAPSSSGVTAYLLPAPDIHGCDFQCWTAEQPSNSWNYYDLGIALYRLYGRTGTTTYQTQARQIADIQWQWVIDHGYRSVYPRAASMVSQFFRALDGHSERFPGLYNYINLIHGWADPSGSPAIDNREGGYALWDIALGAQTDSDPTRHAQYCSWLSTYTNTWNTKQSSDGSWGENDFALNGGYVGAVKSFTPPFIYGTAPWRETINAKAMEAAYESLNDTSSQGCNNTSLAASTLTAIANFLAWQNSVGRDTGNRGIFYEVNYQSAQQSTVFGAGTASINTGSTSLTGSGTNWQTAGYCDGTHFIGFETTRTTYKIASCASDTAATLSAAYNLFSEGSNLVASTIAFAPAASTGCASSASYCYGATGDRNLTRTNCGAIGWLYAQTLNPAYLGWVNECLSAALGGPTAGLTSATNIGSFVTPCAGAACDGYVTDTVISAPNCGDTGNVPPCVNGSAIYAGYAMAKNFDEAFGAPGIDNALAWRRWAVTGTSGSFISGKVKAGGKVAIQ